MSQFVGYKLELQLKDGATVRGYVTRIENKDITLRDAAYAGKEDEVLGELKISGKQIKDLSVMALAPKKEAKKEKKAKENSASKSGVATPEPPKKSKKKAKDEGKGDIEWGSTEKVKLEEFDFAANLEKFNKDQVFKQLSESDTIDESLRLVGHNKVKTKYDNNEMILERSANDEWESASSSSAVSQAPRQRPTRNATPSGSGFQLLCGKEPLPLCTAVQLLEIERIASESFEVDFALTAENASRGLDELVVSILGGSTGRFSEKNHNAPPLVLLLVGNNRSGARALALGRQLTNHGIRVIATLITEESQDVLPIVKKQLDRFVKFGGKTTSALRQLQTLLAKTDSPLELIVDGLQGYDSSLSDLFGEELERANELVSWCNAQPTAQVLSIDVPAGLDPSTGMEESPEIGVIGARWIASIGLPLNLISNAYRFGYAKRGDWTHYLIDACIPRGVFRQGNLKKFDRQWFTTKACEPLEVIM